MSDTNNRDLIKVIKPASIMNSQKQNNTPDTKPCIVRNSLLTEILEDGHIRTAYNAFIAILFGLFVNTVTSDYLKTGEAFLCLKIIKIGFGNIHLVLVAWLSFMSMTCAAYFLFKIWATNRNFQTLQLTRLWDWVWVALLSLYYIFSFGLASYVITIFQLRFASSCIITGETMRLLMKLHSFVRTNAPKVINSKPHTDDELKLPTFSHFFTFLFMPTLIYRDSYKRTEKTDWKFVFFRLLECVATILFFMFIIHRLLNPTIEDFGIKKYTVVDIILAVLQNSISGILIQISIFFVALQSCQNLFGEITRFADRHEFYADWWTSTDYLTFFRKWNLVVQQWLHVYIYTDFKDHVFGGNMFLSKVAVFFISAVVHEWFMVCKLGFFFPLLFFSFFIVGFLLCFIKPPKSPFVNGLFLYTLAFGMGIQVTMYGIEYYARVNVPVINPTLKDYVIPRFWTLLG